MAAPTLKNSKIEPESVYKNLILDVRKLYESGLVHGDLSEYNILIHEEKPVIIDLSQSVLLSHPLADEMLNRDIKNIARFFGKKIDKVYSDIVK